MESVLQGEFRKSRRQPVDMLAGIEEMHLIDFSHSTKIKNMNLTGMTIETNLSLSVGEKRYFRFFLGSGEPIRLQCRIVWHKEAGSVHQYGIIFSDLSWLIKLKLKKFLIQKKINDKSFA